MTSRGRLRVLVVDDQKSMRDLMRLSLRNLGIDNCIVAEDGVEALGKLKTHAVDLVLLDAEMPRMGGVEMLAAVRAEATLAKVSVIMVTGRADADFVRSVAQHRIDGYLVKPVSAAALGARIEAVLRKIA
jgi:two-component system, chemotaxis family, chemotaxis protein CheY